LEIQHVPDRTASIQRKTHETDIRLALNLDGGEYRNQTGVGFFDHMLDHLARHGGLGLTVAAKGDTHVDDHHTVEDVGIALGQALAEALGTKKGIERFGFASVPMDDALARVSVDLSGRAALAFNVANSDFQDQPAKIGTFDSQLVHEFLVALTANGKFNCHVEAPCGDNLHHVAEAIFKALGRALRQAVRVTGDEVPSTKGML
jgi:imidazoleglycerol-phosphate dehydratase